MAKSRRRKTLYSYDYDAVLKLLKRARERAELQQSVLAKRLSLTQASISRFETGERIMDPVLLRDWCRALGESFVKLMDEWDRRLG